jgi:hypothetical protein
MRHDRDYRRRVHPGHHFGPRSLAQRDSPSDPNPAQHKANRNPRNHHPATLECVNEPSRKATSTNTTLKMKNMNTK